MIQQNELMDVTTDGSLLFSEHALAAIPKHKFKVDSWGSLDLFMDFAAELFGLTIKGLIHHGYLEITAEQKTPVKFLGIRFSSKTEYLVHRLPKTTKGLTVGWLEEKILNTLKSPQTNQLTTIVSQVLRDILHDKYDYTNPGKVFLLELFKHQKLDRFLVEEKKTLLSRQIIITPNTAIPDDGKERSIYVNPANEQFVQIIAIVSRELLRFQDLD